MIPVFDITRQNKLLAKELTDAIGSAVADGVFILGPKVEEFERKFAKFIGVRYAVGVACGTDAISLALAALGVKRGDEVIMPANSYPSAFAVTAIGAIPKLVDINPATFNIDPAKIPDAVSKKTKAILPVHMYGAPADMEKIMEIGRRYKISVVEDCAQAVGSLVFAGPAAQVSQRYDTSPVGTPPSRHPQIPRFAGSIGAVGCFSFYPTKNLGCFGDGGMVVTDDREIYEKVKLLRMYGEKTRYNSVILGRNSRLDELQATILLVKLKYLNKWNSRRREIANLYFSHFFVQPKKWEGKKGWPSGGFPISLTSGNREETSLKQSSTTPHLYLSVREITENAPMANKHVYHLFVIRSPKRDQLKKYLEKKGIAAAIHYPVPIHLVPSMKFLGYKKGDFPESEKACREILSLPMFPELTDEEVEMIANEINKFFA